MIIINLIRYRNKYLDPDFKDLQYKVNIRGQSLIKIKILLIILAIILPFELFAGAWVQQEKGYYFKLSLSYFYTMKEFNHEGKKQDILADFPSTEDNAFRDVSITAYLEYGVTNDLTLIANVPFKFVTSEWISNESYFPGAKFSITTEGFADATLGVRLRFLRRPFVLSIQEGLILPMGYSKMPENDGPRLGNGETAFENNLLLGKSLYPLPIYISGGVGYRIRGEELNDEILYFLETGITLPSFTFKLRGDGVKNTSTPPDLYGQPIKTPISGGGGVFPEILFGDQDYFRISPSVIYKLDDNKSIQAEVTNIAHGKNIVSGNIFSFSIILKR